MLQMPMVSILAISTFSENLTKATSWIVWSIISGQEATYMCSQSSKRSYNNGVLVPQGFCNKELQTRWLTTIEMYCLTILEAWNLKSEGIGMAMFLWNLGGRILPCLFLASGGCWQFLMPPILQLSHFNRCLYHHLVFFSHVSVSFFIRTRITLD